MRTLVKNENKFDADDYLTEPNFAKPTKKL